MQILTPESDGSSKDILAENIAKLKELFPEVFAEGKIDFDALKQILGEYVETADERYNFTWNGKSKARWLAQTRSMGTLRPCPAESVNWDTTQHLFIEGDNLEVLKQLQKSYYKKIKMIYIDPPYNTGNDFIYPDNFRDSIKNYLELTGQTDGEGRRLSTNPETSGRFHTDWLNLMYPRLKLARNLLREDGVIFISIDDNEVANLRKICDEIFGEENFIATLVWDRNRKNDAKYFSVGHEYMTVYSKDESLLSEQKTVFRAGKEGIEDIRRKFGDLCKEFGADFGRIRSELIAYYATIKKGDPREPLIRFTKVDEKGPFRDDGNINWPGGDGPRYEVLHPVTGKPCKLPASGWRYPTPERFWEEYGKGRVVFGLDETTVPRVRTNLFENNSQVMASVHYSYAQTAANQFNTLFSGKRVFENPKPSDDLMRIAAYVSEGDDLILDFFSGSCTTAHAVLELNKKDGGNRKFIMVQLPEPCDTDSEAFKAGYKNIAEIGKERIRRVIKKLNDEDATSAARETQNPALFSPAGADESVAPRAPDRGFKVFKLDSSNIKTWDPNFNQLEHTLLSAREKMKPDRTEADVIYEVLLKYGLDLTLPIEKRTIADRTVYIIGGGTLVVCLGMDMTLKIVEKIAELNDEFKPENPPGMRIVFKDNGFASDELKTNAVQILKQRGIEDVRAL